MAKKKTPTEDLIAEAINTAEDTPTQEQHIPSPTSDYNIETSEAHPPVLVECAWEVCNQVGGIYTVVRTKVPQMVERWGQNYLALGPYLNDNVFGEFEAIQPDGSIFSDVVEAMRADGYHVQFGRWLVSGNPYVVLLAPSQQYHRLGEIKYFLYDHHHIPSPSYHDDLFDQVVAFGEMVRLFFHYLSAIGNHRKAKITAHIHEWMAGTAIPSLRREGANVRITFTTHATLLGRYVAMNDPYFYDHLPFIDWAKEADHFNARPQVEIERACAHGAHVFTTVSDVTRNECIQLLGRNPDLLVPNGLNVERFTALHEFQNLHKLYKDKINQFTIGHFFQSYSFNLDNTLYFFTSGRYEYKNKGFDLTTEALARLNWKIRLAGLDVTVVMFYITKRPITTMDAEALQSRALLEELRTTVEQIKEEVGENLFYHLASSNSTSVPPLNQFVSHYWQMRLRRILQTWKNKRYPKVYTHYLQDERNDELLQGLYNCGLNNAPENRVKVVYHPDFISTTNPLFGMDYSQFVRGCHLGIFPSYYEPWGYTPMECVASGVPTVTSDLTGFGDFVLKNLPHAEENGIYTVRRTRRSFDEAAEELSEKLFQFVSQSRRQRIDQRNKVERLSVEFDWKTLIKYYNIVYDHLLSI